MLLATSAFGAASLTIQGAPNIPVDATGAATLTFVISNPEALAINGFSLHAEGQADAVRITSRTFPDPVVKDASDASAVGKLLSAVFDLGATGDFGVGQASTNFTVMTLGLKMEPGINAPVPLVFIGSYNTADFEEGPLPGVSVQLVPEPASMLLVAAGAAFFARRRRAA
jgi:hypothetical protein